jgi:hypothetical protein
MERDRLHLAESKTAVAQADAEDAAMPTVNPNP